MGFDNAHGVRHPRNRYQASGVEADHWHRTGDYPEALRRPIRDAKPQSVAELVRLTDMAEPNL